MDGRILSPARYQLAKNRRVNSLTLCNAVQISEVSLNAYPYTQSWSPKTNQNYGLCIDAEKEAVNQIEEETSQEFQGGSGR